MSIQEDASINDRFLAQVDLDESPEGDEPAPDDSLEEGDIDGQAEEGADVEEASVDDADQEEDDGESDATPVEAIEVEINGQTRRLTAEEVQKGILLESDYTRKTMDLAEARRQFEAERQEAADQLRQQIEALQLVQDPEPDWNALYEEDPLRAPKIERDWREKQAQKHQLMQQQASRQQAQYKQHVAEQARRLPELIPEWSDPNVARAEQQALQQALIADGFAPEDVAQVADARLVAWLRDAYRYRQGQKATRTVVEKKVAGKPKVQKPGASRGKATAQTRTDKKRAHARKTQSRDAWTDVFEDFV